jgi:hypothetical protein
VNRVATIRDVLRLLFFSSAHEPCFISRISILRNQEDSFDVESVEKKETIEIMMDDEGCSETMRYRLNFMKKGQDISYSNSGADGSMNGGDGPGGTSMTHGEVIPNKVSRSFGSSGSGLSFGLADDDDGISYPSASPFSVNGE